jgi:hypothetical protein
VIRQDHEEGAAMDIIMPCLRDRRIAASDEVGSVQTGQSGEPIPIYGVGSVARTAGAQPGRFDRRPGDIRAVILHQTSGHALADQDLPPIRTDTLRESRHRVDRIAAHFVILEDGTIVYTHDVQYLINSAGGRFGIDIEFSGNFSSTPAPVVTAPGRRPRGGVRFTRLDPRAILAGRNLLRHLKSVLPNLQYVHPHGQVQEPHVRQITRDGITRTLTSIDKLNSCPGPDVWVNVGEWAVREVPLICEPPNPSCYRHNHGISRRQRDPDYDQHIT